MGKLITDHLFRRIEALERDTKQIKETLENGDPVSERPERCDKCRWWLRLVGWNPDWEPDGVYRDNFGECRRFPGRDCPANWPVCEENDFCGEFSKIDPVYVLKCHKPVKKPWKGKPRGTENPSSAEFRRLPNAPEKE